MTLRERLEPWCISAARRMQIFIFITMDVPWGWEHHGIPVWLLRVDKDQDMGRWSGGFQISYWRIKQTNNKRGRWLVTLVWAETWDNDSSVWDETPGNWRGLREHEVAEDDKWLLEMPPTITRGGQYLGCNLNSRIVALNRFKRQTTRLRVLIGVCAMCMCVFKNIFKLIKTQKGQIYPSGLNILEIVHWL